MYGRKFQIWHVHQYGLHATLAILLGWLLRRPVVLKLTSSGPQGLELVLSSMPFEWLHRWTHRRVDACIVISGETWCEAMNFGIPEARIRKITNGIDTQEFCPPSVVNGTLAHICNHNQSDFLAVAIGRLAPPKNPLGLLEAWARARCSLPVDAKLIWVGDGPQRQEVEVSIADLGLGDQVVLTGLITDVYSWYAAADVFVLPSHTEGMSNALLEAMACGLPSVATAVSGTSELLTDNNAGLVVPVGNMQAFAAAIVALAQDVDMRLEMGGRARTAVAAYSLDATCRQVEALYIDLLRER